MWLRLLIIILLIVVFFLFLLNLFGNSGYLKFKGGFDGYPDPLIKDWCSTFQLPPIKDAAETITAYLNLYNKLCEALNVVQQKEDIVLSYDGTIYTNKSNPNSTNKLFIFVHGGNDDGSIRKFPISEKIISNNYILREIDDIVKRTNNKEKIDNDEWVLLINNMKKDIEENHGNELIYKAEDDEYEYNKPEALENEYQLILTEEQQAHAKFIEEFNKLNVNNNDGNNAELYALGQLLNQKATELKQKENTIKRNFKKLIYNNGYDIPYSMNDISIKPWEFIKFFVEKQFDVAELGFNENPTEENELSSIEQVMKQIDEIISLNKYTDITLCGHSYGAYILYQLLATGYDGLNKINKLIISSPTTIEIYYDLFQPFFETSKDLIAGMRLNNEHLDLIPYNKACEVLRTIIYKIMICDIIKDEEFELTFDNCFNAWKKEEIKYKYFKRSDTLTEEDLFKNILKELTYIDLFTYPYSRHTYFPIRINDNNAEIQRMKNKIKVNTQKYLGKLYLISGRQDTNAKYNLDFINLVETIRSYRGNDNVTVISLHDTHGYIRDPSRFELFLKMANDEEIVPTKPKKDIRVNDGLIFNEKSNVNGTRSSPITEIHNKMNYLEGIF